MSYKLRISACQSLKLSGMVAVVTGGSRGIGFAIAKMLSENGASVIITAKNQKRLEESAILLENTIPVSADVRDSMAVNHVISMAVRKFGKIDILVNNAGVFPKVGRLDKIDENDWHDTINVNLTGPFRFAKAAIPHLQKTHGCIVNISSNAGLKAFEGFNAAAYSASKAGLVMLTKCWALEYSCDGIRVNCICPGAIKTDMTERFLSNPGDVEFMNKQYPLGRIGCPEEIAAAVLYLVSEQALWITGSILPIDGGESTK